MPASKVLSVPNISCHHCVNTIKRELGSLPGVVKVEADVQSKQVTLTLADDKTLAKVLETLKGIGYPAK
jgi:copper chaperone CopZ